MAKWHFSIAKKWMAVILFMALTFSCMAQEPPLHFIGNKLTAHRNKTLQEKLFVHTDKKVYIAGELLWFKMYYVEGYTHRPLHLSRLAYLELLNVNNESLLQAKVSLKAGEDNGSLSLPLNLPTGNYKIRAYTNWMKNFSPDFYFEKQISVVNTLSSVRVQSKVPVENSEEINFFPEGGYLVKGLPSVLGFKGNDAYGRGLGFKGWILDERNDTVTSFLPLKFGMGSIPFTPIGGHTYKAVVLFANGRRVKKDLPPVQDRGYVMHLQTNNPAQLQIEVRTNAGNMDGPVFLVGHTRQVIRVAEQARLKNGMAVFAVDAAMLEPGITQFTIFDANRQPVAERLHFTRPQNKWKADVQTEKKEYATREKINLSLRGLDIKSIQSPASFSLSVFRVDSVQVPDDMNIENYLLLTSDLVGSVESARYYLGDAGAEQAQATDNLMLTQGWRRFRWQNVLNEKEHFAASYPPELNGPLVTAKVFDIRNERPAAGLSAYLSLPRKQYQVYFAQTDSSGQVQFELNDYFGQGEMILRPFTKDDSLYRIQLQNFYSERFTTHPVSPLMLPEKSKDLLSNYSVGMQVRQVYAGDRLNRLSSPGATDSFSFLGIADYTYDLDQYTRFTTMEEVMREYVRPINVGVRNGKPNMIFIDQANRTTTYEDNVLVMLDGVPLYEHNRVFSYDPLKVKKLEIFARPFMLGPSYFYGVANFSTYKGTFDAFDLDPHLIALNYQGLQQQREFYVPTYETPVEKSSRLPDYRNTLYWNPGVQMAENGATILNFFSSDQKGHYLGLIQGIDSNGHPLVREFTFDVK